MPIWDGFSKIAKSVEEGAKSVTKKAGESMEYGKIKKDIYDKDQEIQSLYNEIGKKMYEQYKDLGTVSYDIIDLCQNIDDLNATIEELEKKLMNLKKIKKCPQCGKELDVNIQFCPECGQKQEMPVVEEEVQENDEVLEGEVLDKEEEE
ncbi:MAG: zinc-ribbon domain-containing protein [Xylanivirga thermophila]|jgi:methyl-accepting chemotaxis protein|uniref:DUF7575 domain-containing protein n=1 Tax=Xylanivirga thermophila TaxID=2496273 RepID=UPI0013ED35F0|nr:zinc-ribbon domain-containing protein [Xylanivirga thermophila]